ncbi:hypothetical protein Y032_0157g3211 [Ancylostoma ceylanicum]|uniref:Uncharacterized protein n=1 Tax=Ancylostoma ceylanicum TaxID=53326 RepID=A0A016SZ10_9BILA|nr:hypothetical protein Y032_0157g3211 [Ancylostoma ceylanicum]
MFSLGSFFVFSYFVAMISATKAPLPPDCKKEGRAHTRACPGRVRNRVFREVLARTRSEILSYNCDYEYAALVKLVNGTSKQREIYPEVQYKTALVVSR